MSSGIHTKSKTDMERFGLHTFHAYSLIQAAVVNSNGQNIQLVKLRNPWGQGEWKGDWSDNSPLWTSQIKQEVGFDGVKEDGIFWMSFKDYLSTFDSLNVVKYHDDY